MKGLKRDEIKRGMVVGAVGHLKVFKKFSANVYVLKEEEGGRKKPFFTYYRPQAFIRTGDMACTITLPEGKEMVRSFSCIIINAFIYIYIYLYIHLHLRLYIYYLYDGNRVRNGER